MGQQPDTWSELALVAITAQGGTDIKFASITETVDIDIGDKDFDVISTLAGGRIVKFTPQEPTEITLEAYPVEAGTSGITTATTGTGFFDLLGNTFTYDASNNVVINSDRTRDKYRIAILWTTDTTATDATVAVVAPTNYALRIVAAEGYFISVKPSFTDGLLKFTVKYKTPPFNKAGTSNVMVSSIGGTATATMTAIASYTSTTRGW